MTQTPGGPQEPQGPQGSQNPTQPVFRAGPTFTSFAGTGQQFTVGTILSRTFDTMKQNLVVFILLTLAATLVPAIVEAFILPTNIAADPYAGYSSMMSSYMIIAAIQFVLSLIMQGAVAYAVYQSLVGGAAPVGDSLTRGFARAVPMILICLIIAALIVGAVLVMAILPGGLAMVAVIAFIVVAVVLSCMWAVIIPACVVEKLGPLESLTRSADLTKGFRVTIFGASFIVGLISAILVAIVAYLFEAILPSAIIAGLLTALVAVFPEAFKNVMVAIMYYDLRAVKEGVTADKLVNVFD